ncbi:MAG: nucleoside-diphosphate sugar epimerase/dehydratase [Cyanobacteria bacterium P01_F01_bin.150]
MMNTFSPFLLNYFSSFVLLGHRTLRKRVLRFIDVILFVFSLYIAIATRFGAAFPFNFIQENGWQLFVLILIQYSIFNACGIYQSTIRYSSLSLLGDSAKAVGISVVTLITLTYFWGDWALARSILVINALATLTLTVSVRLILRSFIRRGLMGRQGTFESEEMSTRLLIYGAGISGVGLLHSLSNNPAYRIVGFIDDERAKQGQLIDGKEVYAPEEVSSLQMEQFFDVVVLAMPSASPQVKRQIVAQLQDTGIAVKTIPSLTGIISGKVSISELRDVDIVDLLGREEVVPDYGLLRKQITDKAVLVTGAGGSIGSELCRQIVQQSPKCLILYELNEFALYSINQELTELYPDIQIVPCLGNVTDESYLGSVLSNYKIETLYHAAAYKHVPLLESNIAKAIENNVLGTLTVAQCALRANVQQFVLISTDKAVRPTNVMGTTKRIAELTIQALASKRPSNTLFAIVRFGNVLGSSGSVVPRFRKQIAEGGPITVTHKDITRYFMSIPEAARLVIQAGAMSKGGEVFLLDMGEPVKIYDLATQMIYLSGLVPGEDISIEITGLRPGEKLYEELLISGDNAQQTEHSKIYSSQEYFYSWKELEPRLNQLIAYARNGKLGLVRASLRSLVPEYTPKQKYGNGYKVKGAALEQKISFTKGVQSASNVK